MQYVCPMKPENVLVVIANYECVVNLSQKWPKQTFLDF